MSAPIILAGVSFSYEKGELSKPVLRDVDLSVDPGEIVLLTGPSGSGKTTLLTLIGALRGMQTGSCQVLGQELMGAKEREMVALRRRIGFIFQSHNLLGFLTARQNVAMSL
ncbi:MAG: ATP-binding cassette domain-containing protein, partial [Elsteraceae bacterium]